MARRVLPAVAVVAGVAALVRAVFDPWLLNYDARYALLWARDAVHGLTPDYTAAYAPTPHPLETVASVLALPFGDKGDQLMMWIVLASFGLVVWLIYKLGSELFSRPVGAVTALVVLTRPNLLRDAVLGYQDVAFAALILGAVLLEARRARRGAAVVALLAVAGLMRPEAWLLAGLYVLYCWRERAPRERAGLIALAAASPALWALADLVVTGDVLHSLHGTAELAEANGRRRNVLTAPYWTAKYFGSTLREPLALGVPIGLAFAWAQRRRRALLPLAVAAAMIAVFMAGPIFGLPLIGRYVRTPAMLVALFYGLAVFGFRELPPGRERSRWLAAGAVAALASIVFIPWHVDMLGGLRDRLARDGRLYRDLQSVAYDHRVRAAFRSCGGLSAADHRPIPHLRYWLQGDPGSVSTVERNSSPLEPLLLLPRRTRTPLRYYRENFPRYTAPPGYRPLYSNASWRVLAAPTCRA